MSSDLVAKVWWEAPHEETLERMVFANQTIIFGRSAKADIRLGHAPTLRTEVPRLWGELCWSRGRMDINNVSDRWGFDLVSAPGHSPASRMHVVAGASGSPAARAFLIEAQVPGATFVLNVLTAPRRRAAALQVDDDPASFVPFRLTDTQKRIAAAVLLPLHQGGSRRGSYAETAARTHYSLRTVRENVAEMDGLFVLHRLVEVQASDDALDRVAITLVRHPTLIE